MGKDPKYNKQLLKGIIIIECCIIVDYYAVEEL